MPRMRVYLAYAWALLAGPIVLATFMGMPVFARVTTSRLLGPRATHLI